MKSGKIIRRCIWVVVLLFILMNAIAFTHAYRFTHFDDSVNKSHSGQTSSFGKKMQLLLVGIDNPRPRNSATPTRPYETILLHSNKKIEGWLIKNDTSKGTVILFHGYGGHKSSMLDKAEIFLDLGYDTFLIDFMGSGGSEGRQTTIGFFEAEEVKSAFEYIQRKGSTNTVLFGTSMGAVAIMKAVRDFHLTPDGIILECPFGTMLETVQSRFRMLGAPPFPMANLLIFWGGIQNNFNAFKHNPDEYAHSIQCPVLLLSGEKDERVSMEETRRIYSHLKGPKMLKTYPLAGHENYLNKYKEQWTADCREFLSERID